MSASFLATASRRTVDASAPVADGSPPTLFGTATVFRELGHLIVGALPLPDAIAALGINRELCRWARVRLDEMWPRLSPLLAPPFGLRAHELLHLTELTRAVRHGSSRPLGNSGLLALSSALAVGALARLETLSLTEEGVGDAGCIALAQACAIGALARLQRLHLGQNEIQNQGLFALLRAWSGGSMAQLRTLDLGGNGIGDDGIVALAITCGAGVALAQLRFLFLGENVIGNVGISAISLCLSEGNLAQLEKLFLGNNMIGPEGIESLAAVLVGSTSPRLQSVSLQGNPGDPEPVQAALRERKKARPVKTHYFWS
jgi:hypothetical protein